VRDGEPLAVLDVGSNTVRLLVAKPTARGLENIDDESRFVRLGTGVDASGELRTDRMEAALEAISSLLTIARQRGAHTLEAIATSAVRDALNGPDFVLRVAEATGVDLRILAGDEEARLTALGAVSGLVVEGPALVCDLGGGSAAIISMVSGETAWAHVVPLGSGRLSERFIHVDPPSPEELAALSTHVNDLLDSLPPASPRTAILTGGTATHIARLAECEGSTTSLTLTDLAHVREVVTSLSAAEVVEAHGVTLDRAQVLPAGVTAVHAIVMHYAVSRIVVTRHGIREGAMLDVLQRRD